MAKLLSSRVEPAPQFSYCAVDYFGPWHIKEGRKEVKKYGALFTCLASRAIVAHSMETDSFLQALRSFTCRRGPIRELRSDQGTNFSGAQNELKATLQKWMRRKLRQSYLRRTLIRSETLLQQVISEVFGNDRFGPCGTLWQHL